MILDSLQHAEDYYNLLPHIKTAFDFAKTLTDKPAGRYEYENLPKGTLFALVQEGTTGPITEGKLENHHRYLDIQIMLNGTEAVVFEDVADLKETVAYDTDKDIAFFEATGNGTVGNIKKDMFYIVFPHDGHMPCRHVEKETQFRKLVIKLKME